jgi:hypothetical protein
MNICDVVSNNPQLRGHAIQQRLRLLLWVKEKESYEKWDRAALNKRWSEGRQ